MHRVLTHRGFEVHVRLSPASAGLYNATFQIKGGNNDVVVGELGAETKVRNGPFLLEKAFIVAKEAGQATIDAVIGEDG